jgi:hypothetical protein
LEFIDEDVIKQQDGGGWKGLKNNNVIFNNRDNIANFILMLQK